MGLFKNLFGGVTEDFKRTMGESLAEVRQSIKAVFEESASTSAEDAGGADDSDVKNPIGELKDAVLTTREGITKLDEESLKVETQSTERPRVQNTAETQVKDNPKKQSAEIITKAIFGDGQDYKQKLWWVENLDILFNSQKYALKYKYQSKSNVKRYIYDDVEVLNRFQARLAQKKPDGSIRYGVAVSQGWTFFVSECDYIKVTYLDGAKAIMAIDEDGDEYAINNRGETYGIDAYREMVQEEIQDN